MAKKPQDPVDFVKKKYSKYLSEFVTELNEVRNAAIDTVDLIDRIFEKLDITLYDVEEEDEE